MTVKERRRRYGKSGYGFVDGERVPAGTKVLAVTPEDAPAVVR